MTLSHYEIEAMTQSSHSLTLSGNEEAASRSHGFIFNCGS